VLLLHEVIIRRVLGVRWDRRMGIRDGCMDRELGRMNVCLYLAMQHNATGNATIRTQHHTSNSRP
jgi:hypothetical protein